MTVVHRIRRQHKQSKRGTPRVRIRSRAESRNAGSKHARNQVFPVEETSIWVLVERRGKPQVEVKSSKEKRTTVHLDVFAKVMPHRLTDIEMMITPKAHLDDDEIHQVVQRVNWPRTVAQRSRIMRAGHTKEPQPQSNGAPKAHPHHRRHEVLSRCAGSKDTRKPVRHVGAESNMCLLERRTKPREQKSSKDARAESPFRDAVAKASKRQNSVSGSRRRARKRLAVCPRRVEGRTIRVAKASNAKEPHQDNGTARDHPHRPRRQVVSRCANSNETRNPAYRVGENSLLYLLERRTKSRKPKSSNDAREKILFRDGAVPKASKSLDNVPNLNVPKENVSSMRANLVLGDRRKRPKTS